LVACQHQQRSDPDCHERHPASLLRGSSGGSATIVNERHAAVAAARVHEIQVVVPADARQIMFMYSRMETGQLEHWIKAARALLGLQRSGMRKMYIDLP